MAGRGVGHAFFRTLAFVRVVTFVVPIAVATSVPLQGLRGELTISRALMFVVIGVISFLIASQVWKRGLKQYSGASS